MRESRGELRKFMRQVKKQNPAANVVLQYDKLFVNHRQGPSPGCRGRGEGGANLSSFSNFKDEELLFLILTNLNLRSEGK